MRHARGFSLLEVLLATLLLASAIAVTAASVRGMARAQARGEALQAASAARNAVADLLRARIASAMPVRFDAGDGRPVMFSGTPTHMEFIADMPPYPTFSGPMRQRLEVQPDAGGTRLCIAHASIDAPALACPPGERTTLARALGAATFRYRGRDAEGRPAPWQAEWTTAERLPEWVEVRITPAAGQPAWPLLQVHLPLAGNAAS